MVKYLYRAQYLKPTDISSYIGQMYDLSFGQVLHLGTGFFS